MALRAAPTLARVPETSPTPMDIKRAAAARLPANGTIVWPAMVTFPNESGVRQFMLYYEATGCLVDSAYTVRDARGGAGVERVIHHSFAHADARTVLDIVTRKLREALQPAKDDSDDDDDGPPPLVDVPTRVKAEDDEGSDDDDDNSSDGPPPLVAGSDDDDELPALVHDMHVGPEFRASTPNGHISSSWHMQMLQHHYQGTAAAGSPAAVGAKRKGEAAREVRELRARVGGLEANVVSLRREVDAARAEARAAAAEAAEAKRAALAAETAMTIGVYVGDATK
jgi:hypothetical protein